MRDLEAGARLKQAWLRRDDDALDHLFSFVDVAPAPLPRVRLGSAPVDPADREQHADREARIRLLEQQVHAAFAELQTSAGTDLGGAVLATALYYQALLGWESTDDFENIVEFVEAAQRAMGEALPNTPAVALARKLLDSIPRQCDTEEARLCACSYSLQVRAAEVVTFLGPEPTAVDVASDRQALILELLERDHEHARRFYARLTNDVAPLTIEFTDALVDAAGPTPGHPVAPQRVDLQGRIRRLLPELQAEAAEMDAAGEVLGGELAVQADALARMADALDQPALLLDRGRLVYVYPFRLDPNGTALGTPENHQAEYELRLHGVEATQTFRYRTITRTDAWDHLAEGAKGVFADFKDRGQLILGHGYELRFRPKWVEMAEAQGERIVRPTGTNYHRFALRIVLGAHGGHYIVLDTRIGEGAGMALDGPWSGADIDQWVRRLTADAGDDNVALYRDGSLVTSWGTLHACASDLAVAVERADRSTAITLGATGSAPNVDFAGASVVFQVGSGRIHEPSGWMRPLSADDDLSRLVGYSALMAPARYLPASVEEWIRLGAPEHENLLAGLRPFGDLLFANGDVLLLLSLGSPNWVVIEQVEMLEFAVSVRSYLEDLGDELRETLRQRDDDHAPRLRLHAVTQSIRTGNRVLELLRARRLMRSRYHAELLDRVFPAIGTTALDARVERTVDDLTEFRRELQEDRLNATLLWLTIVSVFTAFHSFGGSFLTQSTGIDSKVVVAALAAGITAIIAILIHKFRRR